MNRLALMLALGSLLAASPLLAAQAPKYSGTVVSVDPSGASLTLDELGAGSATGNNQDIQRVVELSAETRIVLAARADSVAEGDWPGGFTESTLAATDIKPGDYVTVEADAKDGKLAAISVVVVRPTAQEH